MINQRTFEIQKAITELENPYPKDDLISSYKDYLKVRDYLPFYQFNLSVFSSLLNLTCDLWPSNKRINRLSLLQSIKRYGYITHQGKGYSTIAAKSADIPIEVNKKTFMLFKYCFEGRVVLSPKQLEEAMKICNRILINTVLEDTDIEWLCENAEKSNIILNRVLRYPAKSAIISHWVRQHDQMESYRIRRAELVGWMLDENPDFIIDKQTLTDDFEYFNTVDLKAIREYESELDGFNVIERDFKGILAARAPSRMERLSGMHSETITQPPELELSKRFYNTHLDYSRNHKTFIPDFEKLREEFYLKIDTTIKVTMLWAIAYSRLDATVKTELMKKYYSPEINWTYFKISKKLKLIESLKWLKERIQ
jgi:hypothetical protein